MLCAVGNITQLLTRNVLGPPRVKLGCTSGGNKVIVLAPGANAFWEHYVDSGRGFSYLVKSKCLKQRSVYYKCTGNCIPCTGYSFCSHTVAITESEGNFETIINWYEANKEHKGAIKSNNKEWNVVEAYASSTSHAIATTTLTLQISEDSSA